MALLLCCGLLLAACTPAAAPDATQAPAAEPTATETPAASQPEVYSGTGAGRNGDITVDVTLTDGVITDVSVTSHSETAGISDPALTDLPKAIVAAGSVDVDAVSGATETSNGILAAVKDALTKAGVEVSAEEEKTGTKADYEAVLPYLMGSDKAVASDEYYEGLAWIAERFDFWNQIAEDYAPEVRTLSNGVKVQRTPAETGVYAWQISGKSISYNTYFLDADNRGCGACMRISTRPCAT